MTNCLKRTRPHYATNPFLEGAEPKMKSLADFRKFLAQSGATVQIVKHDWAAQGRGSFNARPSFFEARKVAKLQTNAVKFENGCLKSETERSQPEN